MTLGELAPVLAHYRAGLDAQLALLARVQALATPPEPTAGPDLPRLADLAEQRERLMAAVIALETDLRPLRATIAAHRGALAGVAEFQAVVTLHREAAERVQAILGADERCLEALREAEGVRRSTAQALEQGESTLAAYRRVVSPALGSPALLDRKG